MTLLGTRKVAEVTKDLVNTVRSYDTENARRLRLVKMLQYLFDIK